MNMTTAVAAGLVGIAFCLAALYLTRKMNNSFVTRLISGILLILAALLTIIPGGLPLLAVSLFLSLTAMRELLRATGVQEEKKAPGLSACIGYGGIILYYAGLFADSRELQIAMIVLAFLALLFSYVFRWPDVPLQKIMKVFFCLIYAGVLLSFIYQTRRLPHGEYVVWLIFLSSWGSDTCAYCVGMLIGKHKMTPHLSPKKTIEGAVGGVAGGMILSVVYALLTPRSLEIWAYPLICGAGALLSMVGDLAASAIKRDVGIKDYGRLIPGHGGVMDRFDSVIVTAPVIFFLAEALGRGL